MSTSQKRDTEMDRLLRAVLKPAPRETETAGSEADPGCPDAGALAAFVEGGLTATEQSALDTHIVNCGRCQEALAVLSHDMPQEEEVDTPETGWFTWVTRPRLRWLVPISAAATVAVVILATRPLIAPEGEAPGIEITQMAQAPASPAEPPAAGMGMPREKSVAVPQKSGGAGPPERQETATSFAGRAPSPRAAADELAQAPPAGERTHDKKPVEPAPEMMAARIASEEKRTQPTAPSPVPAPPPPVAQMVAAAPAAGAPAKLARNLEAALVTASAPGGAVLWRFGPGGRLWRSGDAGDTWDEQAAGVTADLLAGSAPSPAICWIVGASGTVLLTTDGERWERRPFPQTLDLVAVAASSARAAVVTARDGRRFETVDAGFTWSPKQ